MNTERADRVRVDLSPKNPFGLTFHAKDHERNLFIDEPDDFGSGASVESQDLLRTVMLAHLIIRHFPKVIETNFVIDHKIFLDRLYRHYGFAPAKVTKSSDQVQPAPVGQNEKAKQKVSFANAHSGGLDSIYRVAKLIAEDQSVMITHIRNLNPSARSSEARASRLQSEIFATPYEEVKLINGTDNSGYSVMRTRDMFLALITAMVSQPYGARKVLIEGDMREEPSSHFSEYKPAWEFFNKLLKNAGLDSYVEGIDAHDIETIGEVLKLEKKLGIDILPLVQNCFTAPYKIAENSPYHWCGSCTKCRRMTLGRLYYHDPDLSGVSDCEINFFVKDTRAWLKNYPINRELTSDDFLTHLDRLNGRVV